LKRYPSRSRRGTASVKILVVLLGALVVSGAVLLAYLFYVRPVANAALQATGQVVPPPPPAAAVAGEPATSAEAVPTPPPLTGTSRINILLLGSDTDAKFAGDYNTQIMIVVTIDPVTKKVSMLSIPRDLWVPIAGHGVEKIGVAFGIGGVALARDTVQRNFGIPIHYYAWVGLDGFIKVIDTLGGVDVDVSHPVIDDSYPDDVNSPDPYAYRRLYIPAGPQHLDGARALEYVRSRHLDLIGDFGRSQRQQQVLDALRNESGGQEIIRKLPQLANDLKDSVRTDMTLTDLARFAGFAAQIRGEAVGQYTLSPPKYSQDGTSFDGQSIVIPQWRSIRPFIDQLFGLNTTSTLPLGAPAGIGPPPEPTKPPAAPTPVASASPTAAGPQLAATAIVSTHSPETTPVASGTRQAVPTAIRSVPATPAPGVPKPQPTAVLR